MFKTISKRLIQFPDTIPPVLQCPDDVFVPIPYWQAGTLVTYQSANATDNVRVVLISYSRISGYFFAKGETVVRVKAVDSSDNNAYCEFKVTVYVSGKF